MQPGVEQRVLLYAMPLAGGGAGIDWVLGHEFKPEPPPLYLRERTVATHR